MGTLHERNPSLWVETTEPGDHPVLDGDRRVDVVVVGAGITGLTTARLLADDGASVAVIDAGPICAGASGYTTAKITALHGLTYASLRDAFGVDRARLYGEANQAAIDTVARLVQDDAIDCGFERRAHIVYTTDPSVVPKVEDEVDAARHVGLPASFEVSTELPFRIAGAVRLDDQAQFHPRAYCLGLAAAVVARGGAVFAHTRARDIDDGERRVVTDHGTLRGDAIVVATHLPLKVMGAYFARCEPSRSYALAVDVDGSRPEDMYLSADPPTRSLRTAGGHLIVGGEGHRVGEPHDTRQHYEALESWAREHFGVRQVTHRWSAQDWATADGVPYIGHLAGAAEGTYVATGFKKWGMSHGTVAASIISDLVAGRDNPWLEVFDATRIAPRQSIKGIVSESVATVKHFVGDRFRTSASKALDDLAPGDGVVVTTDDQHVAAFRDDDGDLHAVDAVCTHLGCLVTFNAAERTWDCPCHGSRFTVDGAVIEGPAVDDLSLPIV